MSRAGGSRRLAPAAAVITLLGAALLSFQVARTAAVADREARPRLAETLWPGHPSVVTDRALLAIAGAASRGQGVSQRTRADMLDVAGKAPLSPDPFVIEAAIVDMQGRQAAAEKLLLEARERDPRSRAARFLLADRYIRSGRIAAGLIEMQALVSLQSRGGEAFAPALVAYARTPGAVPELRRFFAKFPNVEPSVLSVLAGDAANADLVLSLASGNRNPNPDWRGTLIAALVSSGQYSRAHAVWKRLGGIETGRGLYNPGFAKVGAPGPFNWEFPGATEGLAEPDGKGGLDVLYYGRATAILARQLLVLEPGQYRLSMSVESTDLASAGLSWVLRCAANGKQIGQIPLGERAAAAGFQVPAGCEAQWLELVGSPADVPETSEVAIRGLRLTRPDDRS